MYETFVIMSRRCTVQRMCTHCGLLECIAQITYTHSLMAIILMPFFYCVSAATIVVTHGILIGINVWCVCVRVSVLLCGCLFFFISVCR